MRKSADFSFKIYVNVDVRRLIDQEKTQQIDLLETFVAERMSMSDIITNDRSNEINVSIETV